MKSTSSTFHSAEKLSLSKALRQALRTALPATWKSGSWLLSLMIPISLSVTLLQHWGVMAWIGTWLNPLFEHMGLQGSSSVVFISGALAGTYTGLAAALCVPMTLRQATIVLIMIGICHALPMECAVNRKTGSSFWLMGLLRITSAFLCAFVLNWLLPPLEQSYLYLGAPPESTLSQVLCTWVLSQMKMALMIFSIIYSLMIIQRLLEIYNLLPPISRFLTTLMRLFGLPPKAAYMWLVGNVIGLSYGAAVMLELEEKGIITRQDADAVNYHLIMNHSMLEDTIVLCSTGVSALWILGTRLSFAILMVWIKKGADRLYAMYAYSSGKA